MEVKCLFYSKLPVDCVYKIYDKIVYNHKIDKQLKNSIIMFGFFKDNLDNMDYTEMMHEENELLWRLNDYKPVNRGVSEKLKKEYPWITVEYLQSIPKLEIYSSIFKLWTLMSYKKQVIYCRERNVFVS